MTDCNQPHSSFVTSLRALSDDLCARRVGAEETVAAALAGVETAESQPFAVLLAEGALAAARSADRRPPPLPPLHGVPFSVKEHIAVAGVPSCEASLLFPPAVPATDAAVVRLLREAGALLVGTTNMSELALFPDTVNRVYGATPNPRDPARSAGGSSGGEAAAVAQGLVGFGIGSDYGGSIRCPAHFCGIAGLRPGSGVVPGDGAAGRLHAPARSLLSTIGPLARSADDLTLVLDAVVPAGSQAALDAVTVVVDGLGPPVDARCADAVQTAASALSALGLPLTEELPACILAAAEAFDEVTAIETHLLLAPLLNGREGDASEQLLAVWATVAGHRPAASAHAAALARIPAAQSEVRGWLGPTRALLAPAAAAPSFELGRTDGVFELFTHCKVASLAGLPALVVPVPAGGDGSAIGVQLVGPAGSERALVDLGRRLEATLAA
jgi:Asp-tRNA(Asn)/Glu-tRNA(Gln) amidotransferase A subunit family amidase